MLLLMNDNDVLMYFSAIDKRGDAPYTKHGRGDFYGKICI